LGHLWYVIHILTTGNLDESQKALDEIIQNENKWINRQIIDLAISMKIKQEYMNTGNMNSCNIDLIQDKQVSTRLSSSITFLQALTG
jgi:hypothetical protein